MAEQPRRPRRRGNPRDDRSAPLIRRGSVKVPDEVARLLRAGHPWVFRNTLRRGPEHAPGELVQVVDGGGYPLGWGLAEPDGAIALRMISREERCAWDREAMQALVRAALTRRERVLDPAIPGDSFRVLHGESDGFPGLAADRLGPYLLIYKYSRVVESYLETLVPALEEVLAPEGIYMQDRIRPVSAEDRRPPAFHLAGKPAPPEYEVEEDGLRFVVDVTAPVSPGLFIDLREGRRLAEAESRGRAVLNLFSFTGAFGLRAVRGEASAVTNVDAAQRSHARCRQNLAASGFDPEACEALCGDVFKHLERLRKRGRSFDLVVADPPPFSNVKGTTFSALRDWRELMRAIVPVVRPGGFVLAVCNAVRLSEEEFLLALGEGAQAGGRELRLCGERGLPPDFPVLPAFIEGRYLKVKLLQAA